MRTTIDIDDDVLAAVRVLAAERQVSLGVTLSELARRGLRPVRADSEGFPTFAVDPDSPIITSDMVREGLEES